jgi:hypothetical protein
MTVYDLCPTQYLTQGLRLEMESDDPARFFAIDAVLLIGSKARKKSSIFDSKGRFFVKPKLNHYGLAPIEVSVNDCNYYLKLQEIRGEDSRRGIVNVDVAPVNDAPTITINVPGNTYWVEDLKSVSEGAVGVDLTFISVVDAEGDNISVKVSGITDGAIMKIRANATGVVQSISPSHVYKAGDTFVFFPRPCKSSDDEIFTFEITASDDGSPPATTPAPASFSIISKCSGLPVVYVFSGISSATAIVLPVIGLVVCFALIVVIAWFKNHPMIRLTSWRVNILTMIGAALIYVSIFFQGQSAKNLSMCQVDHPSFASDLQGIGANMDCVVA